MSKNQKKSEQKSPAKKHNANEYLKYSGMAFQMAAIILVFTLIGKQLDAYFEMEKPVLTAVLALFSVLAALYLILKDIIYKKE